MTDYPRRAGANPLGRAWKAWSARLKAGVEPREMHEGVTRYAEFCRITGKIGTEYVMQAATFFGPDQHYAEAWTTPRGENGNGRRGGYETPHDRGRRVAAEYEARHAAPAPGPGEAGHGDVEALDEDAGHLRR